MPNVRYRERDAAPLAASSAGKAPQIKLKKGFSRAQKATIASIILLVAWLTILANLSRIPESFHLYAIVVSNWILAFKKIKKK